MSDVYVVGTKAVYCNSITDIKSNCVVSKEVSKSSNVIPVNILDDKGEVQYQNAWVSKDNLTFEERIY